jgi:hypothetical protein
MAIAGNFDQILRGGPYLVGWGAVLREGGAGFFRSHLSSQKTTPNLSAPHENQFKKIPVWHSSSRSSLRIRSWSCAKRALNLETTATWHTLPVVSLLAGRRVKRRSGPPRSFNTAQHRHSSWPRWLHLSFNFPPLFSHAQSAWGTFNGAFIHRRTAV